MAVDLDRVRALTLVVSMLAFGICAIGRLGLADLQWVDGQCRRPALPNAEASPRAGSGRSSALGHGVFLFLHLSFLHHLYRNHYGRRPRSHGVDGRAVVGDCRRPQHSFGRVVWEYLRSSAIASAVTPSAQAAAFALVTTGLIAICRSPCLACRRGACRRSFRPPALSGAERAAAGLLADLDVRAMAGHWAGRDRWLAQWSGNFSIGYGMLVVCNLVAGALAVGVATGAVTAGLPPIRCLRSILHEAGHGLGKWWDDGGVSAFGWLAFGIRDFAVHVYRLYIGAATVLVLWRNSVGAISPVRLGGDPRQHPFLTAADRGRFSPSSVEPHRRRLWFGRRESGISKARMPYGRGAHHFFGIPQPMERTMKMRKPLPSPAPSPLAVTFATSTAMAGNCWSMVKGYDCRDHQAEAEDQKDGANA